MSSTRTEITIEVLQEKLAEIAETREYHEQELMAAQRQQDAVEESINLLRPPEPLSIYGVRADDLRELGLEEALFRLAHANHGRLDSTTVRPLLVEAELLPRDKSLAPQVLYGTLSSSPVFDKISRGKYQVSAAFMDIEPPDPTKHDGHAPALPPPISK